MYLTKPLLRLPLRFDAATLAQEIDALPTEAWTEHPQGYRGNDAVRFVTVDGALTDAIGVPMAPTAWLDDCPYVKTVMAALGAVWGRCRLMRLAPGAIVPPHVDVDFYWRTHVRIHVPIVTNPDVGFTVSDQTVHMAAGECWVFDTFARHSVYNRGTEWRTHLVMDTVGGDGFSHLLSVASSAADVQPRKLPPGTQTPPLAFERQLGGEVMSPWELASHITFLRTRVTPSPLASLAFDRLDRFVSAWHGTWAQLDDGNENIPAFGRLIALLGADLNRMGNLRSVEFGNHVSLAEVMEHLIRVLVHPDLLARAVQARRPQAVDAR